MRKHVAATEENRRNLRQRLLAALAMLMVAVILTVFTSFAWFILSVAPETTGIITNVGANGSLEIALLNDVTFSDPNSITTSTSSSLSQNVVSANEHWGNLIDLNDRSYGLQDIVLYPSRLNITADPAGDGYRVDRNGSMLLVPTYGSDGRIIQLTDKTVTGTYSDNAFYHFSNPDYGVRAIGTASSFSVQSSALALAKGNINTYTASARSTAVASVDGMQEFLLKFAGGTGAGSAFNRSDIEMLETMISRLQVSEDYIEAALRQGLIAIAAAMIADEGEFESARSTILSDVPISLLIGSLPFPSTGFDFAAWVDKQEEMAYNLQVADVKIDQLYAKLDNSQEVVKSDVKSVLDYVMNLNLVLVNDKPFTETTREDLMGMIGSDVSLVLRPGSGVYSEIADFAGNYTATVGNLAKIKTASAVNPFYLVDLLNKVSLLTAADGGSSADKIEMQDLFGYALDLAFRCNAYHSDLLLQTPGTNRVYDDSDNNSSMGGGSYMEFAIPYDLELDHLTALMDAIRVAFVDDDGTLLGVAKLNVTNRVVNSENGTVKVPLYLYEFEVIASGENAGRLVIGQRRKGDNAITSLDRNQAKAISTFVWLDGDIVDNTVVPISSNVSGVLNLQFASSAELMAADNNGVNDYIIDKDGLTKAVNDAYNNYISKGPQSYTTASWINYNEAYNRAAAVNSNAIASESLIYNTLLSLQEAEDALQPLDDDVLDLAIAHARSMMGYGNEYVYAGIRSVDYGSNLRHEGDEIYTPIYTNSSWERMANALYDAEALRQESLTFPNDSTRVDRVITDLEIAEKSLQRNVYYTAYDYNEQLYYRAISDDPDTYGVWYDANFQRVLSETRMLELNAYAKPAEIAYVDDLFVSAETGKLFYASAYLDTSYYDVLKNDSLLAVHWETESPLTIAMTSSQRRILTDYYNQFGYWDTKPSLYYDVSSALNNSQCSFQYAATLVDKCTSGVLSGDYTQTAQLRYMLQRAVFNAEGVDGFFDENDSDKSETARQKLSDLRARVSEADSLCWRNYESVTYAALQDALTNLNKALEWFDPALQVSDIGFGWEDYPTPGAQAEALGVPYDLCLPSVPLFMSVTNGAGSHTLSAHILTKNGVLYKTSEQVVTYHKAAGVTLDSLSDYPDGFVMEDDGGIVLSWNGKIHEGTTFTMNTTPSLVNPRYVTGYNVIHTGKYEDRVVGQDSYGRDIIERVEITEEVPIYKTVTTSEKIVNIEYFSDNSSVLKQVSDTEFYARYFGKATIYVRVTTSFNNQYTYTYPVEFEVVENPDAVAPTGVTFTKDTIEFTPSLRSREEGGYKVYYHYYGSYRSAPSHNLTGDNHVQEIVRRKWSSSDTSVVGIYSDGDYYFRNAGTAVITLEVTTEHGLVFTDTIEVIVHPGPEIPDPEPLEPTEPSTPANP